MFLICIILLCFLLEIYLHLQLQFKVIGIGVRQLRNNNGSDSLYSDFS